MNHEKFTKPWIWIFMGHESLIYILDRYISWPLKRQLQPSMYFMGDESSNGPWNSHMKAQLKTHESVHLTLAQK